MKQQPSVQTLGRALDLLEALTNHPRGVGLAALGTEVGLHKSTVFRLLSMLRERGYVEKDSEGRYSLGLHLVELTNCYLNNLDLKIEARPTMYELTEATRQTVFLALLHGREAVYIDKTETFTSLRRFSIIGTRVPVHCTSLGKALLLGIDDAGLEAFFTGYDFRPLTPNTKTAIEPLRLELRASRERGYTIDDEEHEQGVRCVGAPIRDYLGRVIAAISTSGYASVITAEKIPELGRHVARTAGEISRRMGYAGGNDTANNSYQGVAYGAITGEAKAGL